MSALHPEALIERYRQNRLEPWERTRLEEHLAECEACAFEVAMGEDVGEVDASLQDQALVTQLVDTVIAEATGGRPPEETERDRTSSGVVRSGEERTRSRWLRVAAVAAAVLLATGGGTVAAAALGVIDIPLLPFRSQPDDAPGRGDERTSNPSVSRRATAPKPVPGWEESQGPDTPESAGELAEPVPIQGLDESGAADAPAEVLPRPRARRSAAKPLPDALFAEANEARRSGDARRALVLYRQLQSRFPRSSEATMSLVAAGNLALHELNQPRTALPMFERYLASGGEPLALEARVGKALSAQRLGRADAEREAWEEVLRWHPGSVHAERARKRLAEL